MKKTEICDHCGDDYTPKRRGTQKFCSNSCRSRSWLLKQKKNKVPEKIDETKNQLPITKSPANKGGMTWGGVGEAATGTGIVEVAKHVLGIAPATKKDIQELKAFIKGRYLPVNNAPKDLMGRSAFYDVETCKVVYLDNYIKLTKH